MNIKISLPIRAHRNTNRLLEDMVSKDYINIIYKKLKHALNIYFGVLVWAIRVVSDKRCILFPNDQKLVFSGAVFVQKAIINYLIPL